jgi:hypothetical protein
MGYLLSGRNAGLVGLPAEAPDERDDVLCESYRNWREGRLGCRLRCEAVPQGAGYTVGGRENGHRLLRTGGVEKRHAGRVVVPDLHSTAGPADGDGREGDLLEGEAQMLAVAGAGRAAVADLGGDFAVA